ncbi:MAG: carbohydrate ABC transporter permease [Anaerolineaceae bacterium]|nr:carbohydrate ABC transporter permease [Anaerolineaceae bacterium]MCY4024653.1 carbohydrate ABC transporter permease [Anaerolineaceae bacterium]
MTSQQGSIAQARVLGRRRPSRKPVRPGDILTYLLLTIAAILVLMPLLWMFSTSLRPIAESLQLPPAWLPTDWRFENYREPFESNVPFLQLFINSMQITVSVTIGQLITCSLAGYAFARLRFPGRELIFLLLLASLMVPGQVTIIPIYLSMVSWGFMDNPLAIILPGLISVFGVFLMRQFFKTMPQELLDAARVDGAGQLRVFLQIAVPLSGASLATLAIITFNSVWNSYFNALIFLKSWDKMTLPQGIAMLTGYMGAGNASVVMAAVTMAILPVLIVFIIAQRWIIEALTRTGIKG